MNFLLMVRKLGVSGYSRRILTWMTILHTFKARLVAKGFTQTYGFDDDDETFSPVFTIISIRIIFFIATYYDYEIWKKDVKTIFLNGNFEKDVYMV